MRANAITRIIVWSLVILILLGILAAALAVYSLDLTKFFTREDRPVSTESALRVLPNEETLSFPADSIREIEIAWALGDILILPAEVESIEISESDVSDEKYALAWNQRGSKLEIQHSENLSFSLVGINRNDYVAKDLYIRVPKDWTCDSLEVDAASANLEVRNMTIGEVDFDGADGTCDFIDCAITELDLDTASGDVIFSGTLNSLDFDAVSASFTGRFRNTPSRLDMDSMSGNLDISLPEDCGYTLSMDGLSTTFRSDFHGTKHHNGHHTYGDGRCNIQVDGMSCDVTIRKLTP